MSGYNHLTPYEEQAAAAAADAFEAEAYAQQIAATGAYGLGASAYAGIPGASAALLGAGMYHGAAGAFGTGDTGGRYSTGTVVARSLSVQDRIPTAVRPALFPYPIH